MVEDLSLPKLEPGKITVAGYLLRRIHQLGCRQVLSVPGDFTLAFLDYVVDPSSGLEYVGCANELNAAYAADGYARVKQGLAALVTTFGVGELSALNGIAGSYSEHLPVLHIVGAPSTKLQGNHALLHHTLGDGRFDVFSTIGKLVTCSSAILGAKSLASPSSISAEIDRVLVEMMTECRPGYISLPTDLVPLQIDAKPLEDELTPQSIHKHLTTSSVSEKMEDFVVNEIGKLFKASQRPIVLIDACAVRFGVQDLAKQLIEATDITFFTTPMGKSAIREDHPQFGGVYAGATSEDSVQAHVEQADLTISLGEVLSDFNSGSFTYNIRPDQEVKLHHGYTQIQYATYKDVGFHTILPKLIKSLGAIAKSTKKEKIPRPENAGQVLEQPKENSEIISQDYFWPTMGKFFQAGDIIIGETGTSSFGLLDVQFPPDAVFVSQVLWGSIGYTGGAVLGCSLAARELGKKQRTLLFIGDGSLQLTAQEFSTVIRQDLHPIIFVLNNDGYAIERFIHGMEAKYNDIQGWQWQKLLELFGPKAGKTTSVRVSTRTELEALIADASFATLEQTRLVEVILPKCDAPRALRKQAELTAKANAD
ncbi:uncharacterized protein L969DRAFT_76081 [Mixia osmundae IAM 14324]|uniref:Pyruvate decarboxylase n=1 Tax=Mixia osmundae (strain CBS 9802 / IAM 14324 / JCM 22182 / KY 12970) TaxID=764103 RepID=G7E6N9_MIXOS|nr:uncharacterized protein L969DRAFT_76081 [Mixia osmundae IAM 14324]KEI39121.1 hypothetical protein L969DRAFT_76081 [Mixia osmundae IAM 14324]GAA98499.1 hypothetical protein E5Q_05185 [Mixia osmundae IAM 14324]